MPLLHTLRLVAVPAAGSRRAQVTEHPPSVPSSLVLAEPPAAGIVLRCGAAALRLLAGWLQAMLSLVLRGHSRGARGASAPRAQAGRAGDGLAGSSPLLFPKQPARRCHTRARGCTRKPSHSPCGKEAPATTCEYCPRVVLPLPLAPRAGAGPAVRLRGRESEHEAALRPGQLLPGAQCQRGNLCIRAGRDTVPPLPASPGPPLSPEGLRDGGLRCAPPACLQHGCSSPAACPGRAGSAVCT